jgi:hypothetical protein
MFVFSTIFDTLFSNNSQDLLNMNPFTHVGNFETSSFSYAVFFTFQCSSSDCFHIVLFLSLVFWEGNNVNVSY